VSLYPCARTAAYQLNLGLKMCRRSYDEGMKRKK
jgi:hypothetical protein